MSHVPRILRFLPLVIAAAMAASWLPTVVAADPDRESAPATAPSAVSTARALGDAFSSVAERVSPSVVSIRVEGRREPRPMLPFPFGNGNGDGDGGGRLQRGMGSGFIISADGHVVTNNHVVAGADRIEVALRDGRRFDATVVGTDEATDLAVLKVRASGLRPVRFADSDRARVGEWVVAIGSPFGLDYTVTAGVLSGVGRAGLGASEIEDYLQTDASINPGNSGGPLVDLDGNVLGVNTMIVGRGTGIGFAVPASIAQQVARQIVANGEVRRAWIGVGFQELTPELASQLGTRAQHGAVIASVVDGGPAARAGLSAGDVVVAVAGQPVDEGRDLLRAVIARDVGTPIELTVLRDGQQRSVTVRTEARPGPRGRSASGETPNRSRDSAASEPGAAVGLRLRPAREGRGVVVTGVGQGSPAALAGFETSDVIIRADRRAVRRPEDVARAFADDGQALLEVRRGTGGFFVVLSTR